MSNYTLYPSLNDTQFDDPSRSQPADWTIVRPRYLADSVSNSGVYLDIYEFSQSAATCNAQEPHLVDVSNYRPAVQTGPSRARSFPEHQSSIFANSHSLDDTQQGVLDTYSYKSGVTYQTDNQDATAPVTAQYDGIKWPAPFPTTEPSAPSPPSTPSPQLSSSPPAFTESLKVEPQDGTARFVMEQPESSANSQSYAPPISVPLRATQAPDEMRTMMNAFRINPFTMMHSGEGRAGCVSVSYEVGPLQEEPKVFEFQLNIPGMTPESPIGSRSQSPSSSYELEQPVGENNGAVWKGHRVENGFDEEGGFDADYARLSHEPNDTGMTSQSSTRIFSRTSLLLKKKKAT